jgi:acetyltransferase-like isoleucine patch superfamily enzyme
MLGAGAVVVRETEPRNVYVGNPARAIGKDSFETCGVPYRRDGGRDHATRG